MFQVSQLLRSSKQKNPRLTSKQQKVIFSPTKCNFFTFTRCNCFLILLSTITSSINLSSNARHCSCFYSIFKQLNIIHILIEIIICTLKRLAGYNIFHQIIFDVHVCCSIYSSALHHNLHQVETTKLCKHEAVAP